MDGGTEDTRGIQVGRSGRAARMVRPEHEHILQDTDRSSGRDALRNNVSAAVALADAVRSTLGPRGLDKMLVDADGSIDVTNDGVTVLEAARVEHPTARMLIQTSSAQDDVAHDGTTSAVLLTAELLVNALEWIDRGVHPAVVQSGFQQAAAWSREELNSISRDASDRILQTEVVRTSLAGKVNDTAREVLSTLAVDAAHAIATTVDEDETTCNPSDVKRVGVRGGSARDSRLIEGLLLAKKRLDQRTPDSGGAGRILLIDGGLDKRTTSIDAKIKVTDVGALQRFHDRERADLQAQVDAIAALGCDLLVVRDGVDDDAIAPLRKAGIVCYRRFERADLELLSRATGAKLIRNPIRATTDDLGDYASRSEERIDEIEHVTIIGSRNRGRTLLVRGSTETLIAEMQRGFDDAIGVACGLVEEPWIVAGGGATWIALARHLRKRAPEANGREQLAVEAYAAALESIPRILAENAGLDPLEILLATSAAQSVGDDPWLGLDLNAGSPSDMADAGVVEPVRIARQALAGATEAAISVLRIDDILWAKQDAQTPDWQTNEDED